MAYEARPGQEGVYFDSDGHRLLGTVFLAEARGRRPTALLLHGTPGIEKNYDLAHDLRDAGWNALIFHYRGSWGSSGSYGLRTIPHDVVAALDYLGSRDEVDPDRIAAVGHSLGGWAAVLSAARDERIRAVVAYGAVADPSTAPVTADDAASSFVPWLSGITAEAFEDQWTGLGPEYTPVEQVGSLAPRPLLVLHSAADDVIPLAQGEALYARAGEPRAIEVHRSADHAFSRHRGWLRERVLRFLRDHLDG